MMDRLPATLAAVCLSVYWIWVVVKLVKLGRKLGKDPNALPREPVGQIMRIVWYPCIMALLVGVWVASAVRPGRVAQWPPWAQYQFVWLAGPHTPGWYWTAAVAAVLCVAGTVGTFVCWRKMGHSWRIGIDPGEKLELVSTGLYRHVRHPIYALRMVINLAAMVMAPTPLVIAAAGVDVILLQIEARREERYMESKHGVAYARYKNSVGRFIPRPFVV
jgi:protein-S-isoprenylcysteine O-methyltransferase Ste14